MRESTTIIIGIGWGKTQVGVIDAGILGTPEMLDKTSPCQAVVADATVSYAVGLVCVRQIGVFKVTKTCLLHPPRFSPTKKLHNSGTVAV